jgi:hypothetical protein
MAVWGARAMRGAILFNNGRYLGLFAGVYAGRYAGRYTENCARRCAGRCAGRYAGRYSEGYGESMRGVRQGAMQPDRKNGNNLIPSRYHWDQLDAKVIVLDINFPVRRALCGALCRALCGALCEALCGALSYVGRYAEGYGGLCEALGGALCGTLCKVLCGALCGGLCGGLYGALHSGGNDRFCARLKTDISASSSGLRGRTRSCLTFLETGRRDESKMVRHDLRFPWRPELKAEMSVFNLAQKRSFPPLCVRRGAMRGVRRGYIVGFF